MRIAGDRRLDHGGAVNAGQPQIGDDDVEGEVGQARQGGLARLRLLDLVAAVAELLRDRLTERCFVLDEQEMFQRVRHLATPPRF